MDNFIHRYHLYIRSVLKYGKAPMFSGIEIETISICNRRCSFCPNFFGRKGKGLMEDQLFKKIINELSELDYDGRISLHQYGEPLLDKRLPELVYYAKSKCPKSYIKINTNGDYLNRKIFSSLIKAGADLIYVSQYDGKINSNVQQVLDWINRYHPIFRHKITIRVSPVFTDNRGGLLPSIAKVTQPLSAPCYRPSTTMIIDWKGNVVLCCNDYFSQEKMGNVSNQSLLSIWFSRKFNHMRSLIFKGKRSTSLLCRGCNYIPQSLYNDSAPQEHFHNYGLFARFLYKSYSIYLKQRSL